MVGEEYIFKLTDGSSLRGIKWSNPEAKARIVIITGMEEYAMRYDNFAQYLASEGYEAYCLDHFGQGSNACDRRLLGVWPIDAFEKTVDNQAALIEHIKGDLPLYLFGHSLGSFISQRVIQKYSHLVDKVILCGSNGPDPMIKIGYLLSTIIVSHRGYYKKSKLFNDMVFGAYAKTVKDANTDFDWLSYNEKNVQKYIDDPFCGYGSTGGFYREFLKGLSKLFNKNRLKNIRHDLPILIISGAEDPVGKNGQGVSELKDIYSKLGIENVQLIVYQKMRHEILNEIDNMQVYQNILHFLQTN